MPLDLRQKLEPFSIEARQFMAWARGDSDEPMDIRQALIRILTLYRAALDLPNQREGAANADVPTRKTGAGTLNIVRRRAGHLPFNFYRCVFEPVPEHHSENEPVIASIVEDIEDIFRDVAEGQMLFDEGLFEDACWAWAFNFRNHWSRHAVSALQGLDAHWGYQPEPMIGARLEY